VFDARLMRLIKPVIHSFVQTRLIKHIWHTSLKRKIAGFHRYR